MHRPVAPAHPFRASLRFLRGYYFSACFLLLLMVSNYFLLMQSGVYSLRRANSALDPMAMHYLHPAYVIVAINLFLLLLFFILRHEYILPARRIVRESSKLQGSSQAEGTSLRDTAVEFSRFIENALTIVRDRNHLTVELNAAHERIRMLMHGQQGLAHQTLKESQHLFSTIDAYADYLEELVASDLLNDGVRYDYDEVTEASQNLRFLIQGMIHVVQIETQARALKRQHTDISLLLGRYLMHLTPVLERRSMRVSSAKCCETLPLSSDESVLGHALWAMLTTCMRYAEADTCLHIDGRSDAEAVYLRFYVNVSSPSALSSRERDAYLNALATTEDSVHMFHHTMQQYPNFQLAMRLAAALGGSAECVPDGDYCCILTLTLPHPPSA